MTVTLPSVAGKIFTTTYSYYPDGSLGSIGWSVVAGNFTYTYTPAGQYQEISFANGQTRTYSYDDQGRLTQLANALGATTLAGFSYGYDHDWASGSDTMLGQRTSMTATVPAQGLTAAESRYSYDPLYQLVKAQYPAGTPFNGEVHEWTYDALGNRLTNTVNATTQSYAYLKNGTNPLNGQWLSSDGMNAYSYDANGSQITRTGAANYGFGYDLDNRLTSISGAETATYAYDYQGRRISKTEGGVTTTYLYDGLNPIAESVGGAPRYVLNGPSIDEPLSISASGTISYLNADGLGSIISTNDPVGTVSHSLSFDAWGVPRNEMGARAHGFTYTGREVGVAGLHFYRARFLQPGVGRFAQEDPIGFDGGINLFRYAGTDPIDLADPYGLWAGVPARAVALGGCPGPCPPEKRRFFTWLATPLGEMARRLDTDRDFLLNLAAKEGGWTGEALDHNIPLNNPFGVQEIVDGQAVGNISYSSLDDAIQDWERQRGSDITGVHSREEFLRLLLNPRNPKKTRYNTKDSDYEQKFLAINIAKWRRLCSIPD